MKRNLKIMILVCSFAILSACGGDGGNTNNPNIGFYLKADRYETSQTTQTTILLPTLMRVQGQFLEPRGTIRGTIEQIPITDFSIFNISLERKFLRDGDLHMLNYRNRDEFLVIRQAGLLKKNVNPGEVESSPCRALVFPITVTPSLVDGQSPPSAIEIQAEGISNEHAPPRVAIYNECGVLKANLPATISNLVKGRVQISTPSLTGFTNGRYQVSISNIRADGTWDTIGVAQIFIYNLANPDIPYFPDPCLNQAPQCLF